MDLKVVKELLQKTKDFFATKGIPAIVKEKFEELMLVDGTTKITVEPDLNVGSAIALYAADGTPIPAPIGEYELQDGKIIVVEQDGIIAAINEVAPEEDLGAAPAPGSPEAKVKELIERIETVSKYAETVSGEFKKQNEDLKGENKKLETRVLELEKFVKETFETLLAEPVKEPVQKFNNPLGKSGSKNIFESILKK